MIVKEDYRYFKDLKPATDTKSKLDRRKALEHFRREFLSLWFTHDDFSNYATTFLKRNEEFEGKDRAVQYLVDQNIAKADIKEGCEKIKFIDSTIKESYLEKYYEILILLGIKEQIPAKTQTDYLTIPTLYTNTD